MLTMLPVSGFLHLLLEGDFDELSRTAHSHQHRYFHQAFQNIVRSHGFAEADKHAEGIVRAGAGQTATFPYAGQEIAHHALDGDPGIGGIGLEHIGFACLLDRFFDHDHGATHADVTPIQAITVERTRTPYQHAFTDEATD